MPRIVVSKSARKDIDEIWDYIAVANHNPKAAATLVEDIERNLLLLLKQPLLGKLIVAKERNIRKIVVRGRYNILYRPDSFGINVLRVVHGARLIRVEELSSF